MNKSVSESKFQLPSVQILPRLAQADQTAVAECVEVYGKMIWALAKQSTDSAAAAEKAVPEIFADIWRNAPFCDLEIAEEAVWIALIARRNLVKYALVNDYQPKNECVSRLTENRTAYLSKPLLTAQ